MIKRRVVLTAIILHLPLLAGADIEAGDLPDGTLWYLHADLAAMRASDGGSKLYAWFEQEGGKDIREQTGVDISQEVDSVTAIAASGTGTVIIIDGALTEATRNKVLALAATEGDVDPREYKGRDYFLFGDPDDVDDDPGAPLDDLDDAAFVSFAVDGKAIITGREAQMHELLDRGGKLAGIANHGRALLVLSANQSLVQAGIRTDKLEDEWESNILRNTEQAALLVADARGQLAVEAQLVSTDPKMAEAIGGIVKGLISLQALNSELQPEMRTLIQNTRVEVRDRVLTISTVIEPEAVLSALD